MIHYGARLKLQKHFHSNMLTSNSNLTLFEIYKNITKFKILQNQNVYTSATFKYGQWSDIS